jgi:hypothetical protein
MLNTKEKRERKTIVCLTSYGYRLANVHKAIESIFCQNYLPDKVILYLGEDADDIEISRELTVLEKHGLEIKKHYPDIKSHKKYYFSMLEYPEDNIITVDDDILYDAELLHSLVKLNRVYPSAVVARRVHRMLKVDGVLLPYSEWNLVYQNECHPAMELLATSGAGTLFPPHCMDGALFDLRAITELSLSADDIWLKAMQLKHGTPVVWSEGPDILVVWGTQTEALFHLNLLEGENDRCIEKIENCYELSFADYSFDQSLTAFQ